MRKDAPPGDALVGRRLGEQVRHTVDRIEQDAPAIGMGHELEGSDVLDMDHVVFALRDGRPNRCPHRQRFDSDGLQGVSRVRQVAERDQPVQAGGAVRRQDVDRMPLPERPQEEPWPNRDR